jgi:NAD(P)-dependent dehydrogenase (short-subunit alcohol dehydrogenase family)
MALSRTPSFDLTGKRALVTGASRGIGLACAAALAQAGAHVVVCARSENDLRVAAEAIEHDGGLAEVLPLDICDVAAVRTALRERASFDVLVNNAGINRPMPFTVVTEADFDTVLGLNVRAAFFVAQTVADAMVKARRGGSIIHMSSQMGQVGAPSRTLYCASKWAIEGLNKALAIELAPHGIRSNTICPTFVETAMTRKFLDDEAFRASVLQKIKLGRVGQVEDVMGAVVYLASQASQMMTGAAMVIDGGWTAE